LKLEDINIDIAFKEIIDLVKKIHIDTLLNNIKLDLLELINYLVILEVVSQPIDMDLNLNSLKLSLHFMVLMEKNNMLKQESLKVVILKKHHISKFVILLLNVIFVPMLDNVDGVKH